MSYACPCWEAPVPEIRFCPEHHLYMVGDRKLTSVSTIIKSTWPIKPDFTNADPAVLEHARVRGIRVDSYFQQYLAGECRLAANEWTDVAHRLDMLIEWWESQRIEGAIATQVMLHAGDIAGTPDLIVGNGSIYDLKCTSRLEPIYAMQVGGYADLYEQMIGEAPEELGLIHVTKRDVRFVPVDKNDVNEWRQLRDMWRLVQRRQHRSL